VKRSAIDRVINRPGRNPDLQAFLNEHVDIVWALASGVLIGTVISQVY
jgi:hypothetical protein